MVSLIPLTCPACNGKLEIKPGDAKVTFRENAYTMIEKRGPLAGGMWINKDTFLERAPVDRSDQWQSGRRGILKSTFRSTQ